MIRGLRGNIVLPIFFVFVLTYGHAAIAQTVVNDISIRATVKEGNYVKTNLYFQNATISLLENNKICPRNDCAMEFQDTTFNEFGQDRLISGTLKVEDKANSTSDFKSFIYYKLSGTFHLSRSTENTKTGEKIFFYDGKLGIDTQDAIFNPEFEFDSKVKLTETSFELTGNQI